MNTDEIVFSKPVKYKNVSSSETVKVKPSKRECVGITCKKSPYCFC